MVNTELFTVRNFMVVGAMGIAAYYIFNHFTAKAE